MDANALRKVSQVMLDKVTTVRADALVEWVGALLGSVLRAVDHTLRLLGD